LSLLQNYLKGKGGALISKETPLLANLTVMDNIALILEYHKNLSLKKAENIVFELLKKCNIEKIRDKKPYQLSRKDIIKVKFLRAYVSDFKHIIIERPFMILDEQNDIDCIFEMFEKFNEKSVEIVDLESNHYYKDKKCHIIK
jgi:ABC-type lipoprotein export system ATPase subunit